MPIKKIGSWIRENRFAAITLSLGAILLFFNLGGRRLWLDECYVSVVAQNILRFGFPSCWNGDSFISLFNGNDFNAFGVLSWYSWLTPYVIAVAQFFFGKSEWATRLPFALMGFISMLYFYLILKKLTNIKFIVNAGLILYVFSVPMLLYFRSAQYYSAVIMFMNLSLYFYLSCLERERNAIEFILFGVSLVFLFHANYVMSIVPVVGYFMYALLFNRNRKFLNNLFITYVFVSAFTLPWYGYIYLTSKGTTKGVFLGLLGAESILMRFFIYLWKIQTYFFPFISLSILLAGMVLIAKYFKLTPKKYAFKWDRILFLPILFIAINLIVIISLEPLAHTRRLMPALPLFYMLIPFMVFQLYKYFKPLGYGLVIIMLFTNWLQVAPWQILGRIDFPVHRSIIFQSPVTLQNFLPGNAWSFAKYESQGRYLLVDYFEELTGKYKSRTDGVVKYLGENAAYGQSVLAYNIEVPKIIYYTGLKTVNVLNPDGTAFGPLGVLYYRDYPNARKFRKLDYLPDDEIDWIIYQPRLPFPFEYPQYLEKNISKYEKIYIDAPDSFFEGSADLDSHVFKPSLVYRGFYIYRKRDNH